MAGRGTAKCKSSLKNMQVAGVPGGSQVSEEQASARGLLLISYLFPPVGGVGVQRALSLTKYLPGCGFDVHVLKAKNAAAPVHDAGLLDQIPPEARIHAAFTPELPSGLRQTIWSWFMGGNHKSSAGAPTPGRGRGSNWSRFPAEIVRRILCPEPEVLWVPFALRAARRIVREQGIQTVVVTVPPFSALLVTTALKREFPHLHIVADFRDDWLRFYLGEFEYQKSEYTARRAAVIEREAVELADRVVVVTRTMLDDIRARYPDVDSQKFVFIPNGYDPENIRAVPRRKQAGNRIVVSHVGTVYSASSPRFYLDALDDLPDSVRAGIETRFIGRVADSERWCLEGRRSTIKKLGFVPQSEAVVHMAEADYLLLTMTDAASLTGKLFEYLGTGVPIIAVAPTNGEVARILQETGAGWCAAPGDRAGLSQLLLRTFERRRGGQDDFRPDWDAIRRYERPRLVAQFGRLLESLSQ
jgi:glycosyltransferase involved in cell wall biosynthesis